MADRQVRHVALPEAGASPPAHLMETSRREISPLPSVGRNDSGWRLVFCHVDAGRAEGTRSRDVSQPLSAAEDCHGPAGLAVTKKAEDCTGLAVPSLRPTGRGRCRQGTALHTRVIAHDGPGSVAISARPSQWRNGCWPWPPLALPAHRLLSCRPEWRHLSAPRSVRSGEVCW